MDGFALNYTNLEEWEKRKSMLRSSILNKVGIKPETPAQPVNCVETARMEMGSYTIKNVYWQVLEDYYVAGNIYLPVNHTKPIPAVMLPHGHFKNDRFNDDSSRLAVSLAKIGCMVATYDMVGKGDDTGTPHEDKFNNAIQLHDSIRILDYICGLEYIDKGRIAVTGASGGGTQAMMLAGLDNRISVSVPVCMLSASFNGGCKCENGFNYFKGKGYKTTTAEIAAMFAPKDMLVVSIGNDWTKNTPQVEYPFLQGIYGLYGAELKVKNAHFPNEEHNYGQNKRTAAIVFLAELFNLDATLYDETKNIVPQAEALRSYNDKFPKPANALTNPKKIYAQMLEYYNAVNQ